MSATSRRACRSTTRSLPARHRRRRSRGQRDRATAAGPPTRADPREPRPTAQALRRRRTRLARRVDPRARASCSRSSSAPSPTATNRRRRAALARRRARRRIDHPRARRRRARRRRLARARADRERRPRRTSAPIEQARTLATLLDDLRLTATRARQAPRPKPRRHRQHHPAARAPRRSDRPDRLRRAPRDTARRCSPNPTTTDGACSRAAPQTADGRFAPSIEIARGGRPAKPRHAPHPDQCAAAARLEDAIATATGCEARATPHRQGFSDHPRPSSRRATRTDPGGRHRGAMRPTAPVHRRGSDAFHVEHKRGCRPDLGVHRGVHRAMH